MQCWVQISRIDLAWISKILLWSYKICSISFTEVAAVLEALINQTCIVAISTRHVYDCRNLVLNIKMHHKRKRVYIPGWHLPWWRGDPEKAPTCTHSHSLPFSPILTAKPLKEQNQFPHHFAGSSVQHTQLSQSQLKFWLILSCLITDLSHIWLD